MLQLIKAYILALALVLVIFLTKTIWLFSL